MNTIVVLIDFTEGSRSALLQGAALAKKVGAKLVGLHIVNTVDKIVEAEKHLHQFIEESLKGSVAFEAIVGDGSLNSAVRSALKKISPDLVLVCTHGIKGLAQHLFGAQILKLIQEINFPCIVVQESCAMDLINIDTILFPIGPHPEFMVKIKQTAAVAKILNAKIVIYEIERPNTDLEDILDKNLVSTKEYFIKENINYDVVIEDNKIISLGYFRQTMEYAKENKIYLISQMASVSNNDTMFGFDEKVKFFVNASGLSILSCN